MSTKMAQWGARRRTVSAGLPEHQQRRIPRAGERLCRVWHNVAPGQRAWRGAAWGALIALASILLVAAYSLFAAAGIERLAIGTLLFLAAIACAGGLATLAWRIFKGLPAFYVWVLACTVTTFLLLALLALPVVFGLLAFVFGVMVAASLLGAGVVVLARGSWQGVSRVRRTIAIAGLVVGGVALGWGVVWLWDDGAPAAPPPHVATPTEPLPMPNPSRQGPYSVCTLFYGSGQDRHRPEYGPDADLITSPVDGSAMAQRWTRLRTGYWGFDPEALPLNGRVWYPDGEGPFPLVLVVHGNHEMEDFSDGGYAYLGELLASRGFILASVDENFLNLSPFALNMSISLK